MSTTDTVEQRGYRLIDADTHVNEPPDLWTHRVPAKYRDRVPHMEQFEQGDAWVGEGVTDPINFGFNAAAKLLRSDRRPWVRFEDIPAGGYDPADRLEEMDADLVDAAVFYPTPRAVPDRHRQPGSRPAPGHGPGLQRLAHRVLRLRPGPTRAPSCCSRTAASTRRVAEIERVAGTPGWSGP